MWSADPQLAGGAFLKINGIAFDGDRTLYTTNYSTGELFAVRHRAQTARAEPAVPIALDTPMTNPDGIRWHDGYLYVAENGQRAVTRRSAHRHENPDRRLARSADVARVRWP